MKRAVAARCWLILIAVSMAIVVGCSSDPAADETDASDDASGGGSAPAGSGTVPEDLDIEVELRTSRDALPLGAPLEYTIAIRNDGAKSVSVPVELVLAPPSGDDVSFYTTTLFAPTGDEVTEDGRVTPSQWFADLGRLHRRRQRLRGCGRRCGRVRRLGSDGDRPCVRGRHRAGRCERRRFPKPRVGGSRTAPRGAMSTETATPTCSSTRLDDPTQLFINDGAGGFVDESEERGLSITDANGAAFADYDNDGDADLIVVRDGSDLLFRNDGDGRFSDVSVAAGIGDDG